MILGKVVGNVWSTKKNEKIHALRMLFVQPLDKALAPAGQMMVAADEIGAGSDDLVLITRGGPAQHAFSRNESIPVDAVVIAIVDSLEMYEKK